MIAPKTTAIFRIELALCQTCELHFPRLKSAFQKIARIALRLGGQRVASSLGLIVALSLCPVQTFADLGFYLAAVNLAALSAFGRYELLILSAKSDAKYLDSTHLCIVAGSIAILTVCVVGAVLHQYFSGYLIICFVGALTARLWLRFGLVLATRHCRYDRAVKALLPHAIAQPAILVLLIGRGVSPLMAFILADLLGQFIAAVGVCWSERRSFSSILGASFLYLRVRKLASENVKLPTLNLVSSVSAFVFAAIPLFYLPTISNGILAGTLALLFRLLEMPASIASSSIGPVMLNEIAGCRRGETPWVARSAFLLPAIISGCVFGTISIAGLTLSKFNVTPSWHLALIALPVVALFQAGIAATLPLIDMATLAGRQNGLFAVNAVSALLAALAVLIWRSDPTFALLAAGAIGCARVIVMSIWLAGATDAEFSGQVFLNPRLY